MFIESPPMNSNLTKTHRRGLRCNILFTWDFQMDLSVETITAKQAEKYLQFNTNNRPLRKSLVSQYAKDMASGNWRLTHQGVAFNCDGTLLDGQHRLAAIVQSGVTVQMLVARGVDSRNQLVMDDHAKRSAGDALIWHAKRRSRNRT